MHDRPSSSKKEKRTMKKNEEKEEKGRRDIQARGAGRYSSETSER